MPRTASQPIPRKMRRIRDGLLAIESETSIGLVAISTGGWASRSAADIVRPFPPTFADSRTNVAEKLYPLAVCRVSVPCEPLSVPANLKQSGEHLASARGARRM